MRTSAISLLLSRKYLIAAELCWLGLHKRIDKPASPLGYLDNAGLEKQPLKSKESKKHPSPTLKKRSTDSVGIEYGNRFLRGEARRKLN